MLSSHLRLGLPNGLFLSGFPTRTLCTPLSSPIRATCPGHLILYNVNITGVVFLCLSSRFIFNTVNNSGDRGRCCATNRKVAGSIPAGVIEKSFRSHYGPGVDSASNRNEYQKHFLGGKGVRCVRLTTLPPSCAVVEKSGNFNFLEPSGPFQACNGTALLLL